MTTTTLKQFGTNKRSAAERAMKALGQPVAFEIRHGAVRIGTVTDWSLSGGDDGGWLVHYGIKFQGKFYQRSEEAVAVYFPV